MIEVRRNAFENDDVVLLDDVYDFTLDIREAFSDQGRLDMLSLHRGQREFLEFVGIGAGTGSHPNDFIEHVDSGN